MGSLVRTIVYSVAVGTATALLASAAVAGNPGNPGSHGVAAGVSAPPGQAKKGNDAKGNAATATATAKGKAGGKANAYGKAKHGKGTTARVHPSHPAKPPKAPKPAKPSHPVKPPASAETAAPQRPAFAQSKGRGHEKTAHHKVIICHRTGSSTNPYVVINISINAWLNGHTRHPALDGRSDILLEDPAAPGEKAAGTQCGAEKQAAAAVQQQQSVRASTTARAATRGAVAASGVKGVSVTRTTPPKRQRAAAAGGVLGAVAAPVTSAQLPFTGLSLWIAAAIAAALLAGGLAVRRAGRAAS